MESVVRNRPASNPGNGFSAAQTRNSASQPPRSRAGSRSPHRRWSGRLIVCAIGLLAVRAGAQTTIPSSPAGDEFSEAYRKSDWPRAVDAAEALVRADSRPDPLHSYVLACALARDGRQDAALQAITTCVERGWFNPFLLERDPDLHALRAAPAFVDAVEKSRRTASERLARYKAVSERIQVEKFYPRGFAGKDPIPMIIALHRFGGSSGEIAAAWRNAASDAGAVLVVPSAPHTTPLEGRGWGATEEGEAIVLSLIDTMVKSRAADETKIVLAGFAQGGALAATIGLRHPEVFAGVIPVCGVFDPAVAPIPEKPLPAFPRFAILNGADNREAENNREAAQRLHRLGTPTRFRLYPGVDSSFPPNADAELASAARFVLGLPEDTR